jgi:hypothetical protein
LVPRNFLPLFAGQVLCPREMTKEVDLTALMGPPRWWEDTDYDGTCL